jgi:hypothetical protein
MIRTEEIRLPVTNGRSVRLRSRFLRNSATEFSYSLTDTITESLSQNGYLARQGTLGSRLRHFFSIDCSRSFIPLLNASGVMAFL